MSTAFETTARKKKALCPRAISNVPRIVNNTSGARKEVLCKKEDLTSMAVQNNKTISVIAHKSPAGNLSPLLFQIISKIHPHNVTVVTDLHFFQKKAAPHLICAHCRPNGMTPQPSWVSKNKRYPSNVYFDGVAARQRELRSTDVPRCRTPNEWRHEVPMAIVARGADVADKHVRRLHKHDCCSHDESNTKKIGRTIHANCTDPLPSTLRQ